MAVARGGSATRCLLAGHSPNSGSLCRQAASVGHSHLYLTHMYVTLEMTEYDKPRGTSTRQLASIGQVWYNEARCGLASAWSHALRDVRACAAGLPKGRIVAGRTHGYPAGEVPPL
jgi:hypothetical protein